MKQSNYASTSYMPKTLLKFYFKKCFPGLYKWIVLFMVFRLFEYSGSVVFPYVERWIVAMFEGAPMGTAIYAYVMPTILLLVGINMGYSTIAIAHRLSTLRNMDRIVVLNNGKIIESGTHKGLLRRRGEYARLWKMQSGGFLQEETDEK